MKSLHLLRHAKSSWKDPGLNDHDRPLSKRGRQTAKMMAAYLRRANIAPDLAICSTAMRAQQTINPIAKAKKTEHPDAIITYVRQQIGAVTHVTHRIGFPKTGIEEQCPWGTKFFKRPKTEKFAGWRAYTEPYVDPRGPDFDDSLTPSSVRSS